MTDTCSIVETPKVKGLYGFTHLEIIHQAFTCVEPNMHFHCDKIPFIQTFPFRVQTPNVPQHMYSQMSNDAPTEIKPI